ncbi:hypothetical protein GCM10010912_00530 [Paenibacillus albidus]|uniref:Response regulator n=1 Tax=Paenibacillus albidus TaxID=2041023 RepID=A0A917F9X6_9BACL|nr:helix-turn-helix domain-containing protein [Paenibacillus albidus]GGF59257.1 hypothetical protein GCM10010912_00530 [Paenibacillus albidus]
MKTILLVEDEPFVRRSIRSAIPWEEHGLRIAAEASHGLEALDVIHELKPDIVITDVFMPYMDGIELLQKARAEGCEASFIMLTCAGEFEYARMALEYGASSYILKLSMDDSELLRALDKVKVQLDKRAEQQDVVLWDTVQERLPYLWKNVSGKEDTGIGTEKQAGFRRLQDRYSRLVLITSLNGTRPFSLEEARAMFPVECEGALRSLVFVSMGVTTHFLWKEGKSLVGVRSAVHQESGIPVICRTSPCQEETALESGWLANVNWLDYAYYDRIPERNVYRDDAQKRRWQPVPWEMEQEVIRLFERSAVNECASKLSELWRFMQETFMPMTLVKETAERLDKLFARISHKPAEDAAGLLSLPRHSLLLAVLTERMQRYAKGRGGPKPPETDHPEINAIIRYLIQHYDSDISLQAMAQYVRMDENYLSGLFKKKTGDTFINYLQRIRVNEAKVYLEETDLTVAEIGERSGFVNPSYFFKIFKRWTGATPSEYRTEHKNKEAGG